MKLYFFAHPHSLFMSMSASLLKAKEEKKKSNGFIYFLKCFFYFKQFKKKKNWSVLTIAQRCCVAVSTLRIYIVVLILKTYANSIVLNPNAENGHTQNIQIILNYSWKSFSDLHNAKLETLTQILIFFFGFVQRINENG